MFYIQICFFPLDCLMYSRNSTTYSILTGLNSTYGNISFWIKLWDPLDERNVYEMFLITDVFIENIIYYIISQIVHMYSGRSQDFVKLASNSVLRQKDCPRLESRSRTFNFKQCQWPDISNYEC